MLLRPVLVLEVAGVADPVLDAEALIAAQLARELNSQIEILRESASEEVMLTELRRTALEDMYSGYLPGNELSTLEELEAMFVSVPESTDESGEESAQDTAEAEPVFDELAYVTELESRLLDLQVLPEGSLETLASDRAAALMALMLSDSELTEDRILLLDVIVDIEAEDEQIQMEVELGTP
jgi:hypothetical protein